MIATLTPTDRVHPSGAPVTSTLTADVLTGRASNGADATALLIQGRGVPVIPGGVALDASPGLLEQVLAGAVEILDRSGRWCMIGTRNGFIRHHGCWWYATRQPVGAPRLLVEVAAPVLLAGLDGWELDRIPADTDPTPAHGMPRPHVSGLRA
jgi:hypothetical protein